MSIETVRLTVSYLCAIVVGAIGVPVVLLVLEGGPNTVRTMCELIKKKIPAVVVDGSGRAADVVAYAYSLKKMWALLDTFMDGSMHD